ncbi:hypothetical protein PYCCODRAFT_1436054 [Trametes coccinea BRFM310]|uniref:Uncharacterized protein n=1 Tax=Trametes coccinea (strain BRFM310) TaxID=1353009 RepID=A0A1Y2IKX2_TRAC3|nr:hypothetical protein PYCCODRAFT_1436054 [Trametes coccinea BRFM310]
MTPVMQETINKHQGQLHPPVNTNSIVADMAVDLPSWTTLSTENTSDEEDVLLSDSRGTTPDPAEKEVHSSTSTTLAPGPPRGRVLQPVKPWARKRRAPIAFETTAISAQPQAKKPKPAREGRDPPPLPSVHTNGRLAVLSPPFTAHSDGRRAARTPNETATAHRQPPASASEDKPRAPELVGTSMVSAGAPMRPQRKAKLRAPITEDSDMTEWERVDRLLETHVAPALVLLRYAQSSCLHGRKDGIQGLRHVLQLDDFRQVSRGKGRAQPMWTEACWSNVGEFKERLDRMFGPGHFARGQCKPPKNAGRQNVHDGSYITGLKSTTASSAEEGPEIDVKEGLSGDGRGIMARMT